MPQFDVHRNAGRNRATYPFLLDVQTGRLRHLATRLVVPLGVPTARERRSAWLLVPILDDGYMLIAHDMFPAPRRVLGPVVASLADQAQSVINAIDDVITTVYG